MDWKTSGCLLVLCVVTASICAQREIIGAKNHEGVTVHSSSAYSPAHWEHRADGANTINGNGLDYEIYDASRFLMQATLGANRTEIERTVLLFEHGWMWRFRDRRR